MTMLLKITGLAALCWLIAGAYVYMSQRRLVYSPTRDMRATPADAGLPHEDVFLTTAQGTRIHAWWTPCPDARLTVLFCHGNGGNLSHRVPTLQILHELNVNVLAFDYSGYGQSTGKPSETATRADVDAAWNWLTQTRGIAAGSIVLQGRSLGGGVAADLAARLTDQGIPPAGLIMESTFTSIPDMGADKYPWLPVRLLARFRYESARALERTRIPALFIHSPDDDIVPFAHGRRLFEKYEGPREFLQIHGDHNSGYMESGEIYRAGLDRFLTRLATTVPARQ